MAEDRARTGVRRLAGFLATAGDHVFAALIIGCGLVGWSPLIAIEAAREMLAAREEHRLKVGEIGRTQSEIWVRQVRRNAVTSEHPATSAYF